MIWTLLLMLGVPLWLCVMGISVFILRNRKLRKREGDIPARICLPGHHRWMRGHAVWVSDVLAWRGSPAAWRDEHFHVVATLVRAAADDERRALHGLGDDPAVADLGTADGRSLRIATRTEHRPALWGPFCASRGADGVSGPHESPTPRSPISHDAAGDSQCDARSSAAHDTRSA